MADAQKLVPFILSWEGGYVNDPDDVGGATNKGITIATWRLHGCDNDGNGDIDADDLRIITNEQWMEIFKCQYWDRWKADEIENQSIANIVGVDEYYSEVLPEDKAKFVEQEKQSGHKVIMIGDGINDSPALSAADVGIAISDGAQIAREIADVTIGADNLYEVATLKELSNALMARIHKNYRMIVGINTGLIVLGVAGMIPPTTSALLHNTSTLWISTKSMKNLLDKEEV